MMKYNLRELVIGKLIWDNKIPDDLQLIWKSHSNMIQNIGNIKFNRAVNPNNQLSLDINAITTGDAYHQLACVTIRPYNPDLLCIWQSNTVPFCENYAKLCFYAKHFEKGLNRVW